MQKSPALLDLKASLEIAVSNISDAADQGAQLVVFPETWLTGYPAWVFGLAGWGDDGARYWHARLLQESPIVGARDDMQDGLSPLRQVAKERRVSVSIGLNERSAHGGSLYNSIALIGSDGCLLNLHRKLVPTHTERIVWGYGDAAGLKAVETPIGRVGALICWEHWMPLARQALHATGEQIHVSAWPDITEMHEIAARSYAFEGRCFVLSAGMYLETSDIPEELHKPYCEGVGNDAPGEFLFNGGSAVIGPQGDWLVEPVRDRSALIIADLELEEIDRAHQDLDIVGHYSRNDIFELRVDTRRRLGVEFV